MTQTFRQLHICTYRQINRIAGRSIWCVFSAVASRPQIQAIFTQMIAYLLMYLAAYTLISISTLGLVRVRLGVVRVIYG